MGKICLWLPLFFLVGCNSLDAWIDADKVTEPFNAFSQILDAETSGVPLRNTNRRQLTVLAQDSVAKSVRIAKDPPRLTGQMSVDREKTALFVQKNKGAILAWLDSFDRPLETLRKILWASSKNALDGVSDRRQAALDYGLAFFCLRAIGHLANRLEIAVTPLATALVQTQQEPEFARAILTRFATYVGLGVVVQQDLKRVSERMRQLQLPDALFNLISGLAHVAVKERALREANLKEMNADRSEKEKREILEKTGDLETTKNLLGQTLLYGPGQAFSFLKLLAVISNLTWGLINSVVGLGVILVAMVASPFSEYVDFPTFTIADNGFQIWVGIPGIAFTAFSLGVFVLGNSDEPYECAHEGGHAFQSALLGPFYLPVVGISYMIQGREYAFVENWANLWAGAAY